MPKLHTLAVLAGIAGASAALAQSLPAQARTFANAQSPDTYRVSATMQTPIYFRTAPRARCFIGTGASSALAVYADDAGVATFTFQLGRWASPSVHLLAACDAAGRHVTIPLSLQAVAGPVAVVRPPVVLDVARAQPLGFNPATASDYQLERYGYPPRPDLDTTTDAYAEWLRAVTAGQTAIASTGVLRPDRIHDLSRVNGTGTSSNWSGMVDVGAHGQFDKTLAKWDVPSVGVDEEHSPAYSSLWVGLDGYSSGDIVQDGTESDAVWVFGSSLSSYFAWVEYYPDGGATELPNFDLSPGDQVYMSAKSCRNKENQFVGCFFLVNITKGERTSATERPPNSKFTGNNAEWILERPRVGGDIYDLPDYNFAETTDMLTFDTTKQKYSPYAYESYDSISMVNGRDVLSVPAYVSKNSASLTWKHYR
jgi:hypothetical protein